MPLSGQFWPGAGPFEGSGRLGRSELLGGPEQLHEIGGIERAVLPQRRRYSVKLGAVLLQQAHARAAPSEAVDRRRTSVPAGHG